MGLGRIYYEAKKLNPNSLSKFYGKKTIIQGEVISIPSNQYHHLRFYLRTKTINNKPYTAKLQLNWYGHRPYLMAGSEWQLLIKLKRVSIKTNARGFNYQRYLYSQGVLASGYVIKSSLNKKLVDSRVHTTVNTIRQRILLKIKKSVSDKSLAGILTALTLGSRYLLSKNEWQVFQATGTSHLIAVSGLHVGLCASLVFFILNWCWRIIPRLCILIPAQRVATVGALIGAFVYAIFAGLSIPTYRSIMMLLVMLCASLSNRNIPMWYRFLFAVVVVLAIEPFSILSVSFWLSYLATSILGLSICARLVYQRGITQWLRIQWQIFIGLVPVTLIAFHKLSLISLVTNLFAIPYVSFVVLPLSLLAMVGYYICPGADKLLWLLSAKTLMPLWWGLKWLAQLRYALWWHPVVGVWEGCCLSIAAALCLLPRGFPARILAMVFGCVLFFSSK